jgi:hypothetical protein
MHDIYSQSRVTCLTYIHRPPRQPAQRASTERAPKPSKAPHTAARRSEPAASKVTAPTTVSIPKGPSKALNRHLWGNRGPRHSRQAPQPARAHTRPATQPHQWTHEPAQCPGTNAGRGPPATDLSACEWHSSKRAVRVVAAPARPVDTRSQSSCAIQAAVSACNHCSVAQAACASIQCLHAAADLPKPLAAS